jgi:ankyrin repeat protein
VPLLDLPNELVLEIQKYLDAEGNISAFAQTNKHFYRLLTPKLYGYNVRWSDSSALLWGSKHGQEATCIRSLREEANIQATDEGRAPLSLAAEYGHIAVVKLLLDKSANVNAQGGRSGNALQAASYKG